MSLMHPGRWCRATWANSSTIGPRSSPAPSPTWQPERVSWELGEVPSLVEQLGAEEVGRLYAIRTLERLRAIGSGSGPTADEDDNDPLGWIEEAAAFNDDLDPELRLRIVIAATNEADHDDVIWCIGDQPAAHLAAVPGFARRLHQARAANPNVERLFRLMQDYCRNVEGWPDAGWWDDDCASLAE